jgi:hypothetical protein
MFSPVYSSSQVEWVSDKTNCVIAQTKRPGEHTAIMWLVGQTVYDTWSYISFPSHLLDDRAQIPFARCFITAFVMNVSFVSSSFPPERSATSDSLSILMPHLASNLSDSYCYVYFVQWTKTQLSSFLRSFIFPSCHFPLSFILDGRISR